MTTGRVARNASCGRGGVKRQAQRLLFPPHPLTPRRWGGEYLWRVLANQRLWSILRSRIRSIVTGAPPR